MMKTVTITVWESAQIEDELLAFAKLVESQKPEDWKFQVEHLKAMSEDLTTRRRAALNCKSNREN